MVLAVCSPSEAALGGRHECALSQVGSHPDMTLDVAMVLNNNKYPSFNGTVSNNGSQT